MNQICKLYIFFFFKCSAKLCPIKPKPPKIKTFFHKINFINYSILNIIQIYFLILLTMYLTSLCLI